MAAEPILDRLERYYDDLDKAHVQIDRIAVGLNNMGFFFWDHYRDVEEFGDLREKITTAEHAAINAAGDVFDLQQQIQREVRYLDNPAAREREMIRREREMIRRERTAGRRRVPAASRCPAPRRKRAARCR